MKSILHIFESFSRKERILFSFVFVAFAVSLILYGWQIISNNTILSPIDGGEFTEGAVGQPIFINPIYAQNNQIDNDIARLIFSDIKTLSEKITQSDNGIEYNIRIKPDVKWHDNQPITADDISFTIKNIQDPDSNSPLASMFKGVFIERMSEREIKIILPTKYSYFREILENLQPIPKHLFENIPSPNIKLSSYNLEPIGNGPFKFSHFEKRKDGFILKIVLRRNEDYTLGAPHIETFSFRFYNTQEEMIKGFNAGETDGIGISDLESAKKINIPHQKISIPMARYYAIFFNSIEHPVLSDSSAREALRLATDNKKIAEEIFGDMAAPINKPIVSQSIFPFKDNFSIQEANRILDLNGWIINSNGIREKGDAKMEFSLTVYPSPFLEATAKKIQEDWKKIGAKMEISSLSTDNFPNDILKPRNYEMLLFGNTYNNIIDPYSFWNSTQKFSPGLNLSLYQSNAADSAISKMRTEFNEAERDSLAQELTSIIEKDTPAIFLYSVNYNYIAKKRLKGFEESFITSPSDRFSNINNWSVRTIRILK